MKKIYFPLFFLLFLGFSAFGQTARQYIKAANEEFSDKNYYSAMKHYEEAMDIDGEKLDVMFKYAEAARLFSSYTYADTAYTKVVAADSLGQYPLAMYHLAFVKKKQGKYEESQSLFQQFVELNGRLREAEKAQAEVEELNWAIDEIKKVDEDVKVEQLNEKVNSHKSEFAPVQVGETLYFTSQTDDDRDKEEDRDSPFYSKVKKSKIGSAKVEAVEWNEKNRHTAHSIFTEDGKRLFYTLCDFVGDTVEIRCELYSRNLNADGTWGKAQKLPQKINQPGYTVTSPCLGRDEATKKTWLYFVSDRPDGKGGLDVFATILETDSTYSDPFNLKEINTPGDEMTPMFHNFSQTLYFSSDGRQNLGGLDVYEVARKGGEWLEVKHLPVPYNSSYDDTHFWLDKGRVNGYFASNRLGGNVLEPEYEACCFDLYQFSVQVIDLEVFTFNKRDSLGLEGVKIQLFEITPSGEVELVEATNTDSNDFDFQLKKGVKYVVLATREGYLPVRQEIDLTDPKNTSARTLRRDLYLVPEQVDLKVLTFNKKTLNPLKNVEVRLAIDGQEVDFKQNKEGNEVSFTLERGKVYELIGAKVAYFPDTVILDLTNDVTTIDLEEKLFLRPKEIEDFPPLVIYFDNDRPNPKTRKTTTELTYKETWDRYMEQKGTYVQEYVKSLVGFDSITSTRRMDAFFEREVKNGYLSLEVFTENVLEIMEDGGFKVELIIQGFTSPRASADYNFKLSQRRSDCLKNHFERWNGGVLKPYIDQGRITLEVVGYGEKLSPQYISDKLDDERESIYSVQASFERKVAIIGARRVAEN